MHINQPDLILSLSLFPKGDRIVAINGQSLLNLRYEEALKMLQSSAKTVDLVLSQIVPRGNPRIENTDNRQREPIESNYLQSVFFFFYKCQ